MNLKLIRENMNTQLGLLDKRTEELERLHRQQVEQLETISGLSAEDAKNQLIESLAGRSQNTGHFLCE